MNVAFRVVKIVGTREEVQQLLSHLRVLAAELDVENLSVEHVELVYVDEGDTTIETG